MTDNAPLHPRHPGRGSSTSLIAGEGESVEEGGFLIFFPSGTTKKVAWRSASPITPTIEAAKKYTAQVLDELLKAQAMHDVDRTNWVSVIAAIQKIISDFNDKLRAAIGHKIATEMNNMTRKGPLQ